VKRPVIAALVAISSLAPSLALGASKILPASKDNTVFQEGDLSNGGGIFIFCGMTAGGETPPPDARRAFLAFAIADSIPPGAVIDSVRLTLHLSRTPYTGTYVTKLHRVAADWGEGASNAAFQEGAGAPALPNDVTWVYSFFNTTTWTTPGGDFVASASAQLPVASNPAYYTWSSAQMAADVQSWLLNPASNFGWVVIGDESLEKTAERFDSREYPTVARRPQLTVYYTQPVAVKPVTWGQVKALYR